MQRKTPKYLSDILDAAGFIQQLVRDQTLESYREDRQLRQAVERNFEIIGEAMNRVARTDPAIAASIGDYPRIIAFRNILSHGYDLIEDEVVWKVIQEQLAPLQEQVETLLRQVDSES